VASSLTTAAKDAAAQLLRAVPGTLAFRRDLRDAARLAEADAVIVSYPKSGRTFVRAMLARLYQRRFGIDERQLLEYPLLRRAPAPRVLFTHAGDAMRRPEQIHVDPAKYNHAKVVLLARHPADVAISRYYHLKHRSRDAARQQLAEQPLEAFVWADQGGIPSIVTFLNAFAAVPGVTITRYRDFIEEPEEALSGLASAIGLECDAEDIADAVDFARLPNLKQREREGYFLSSRLRRTRSGDAESGKVRNGKAGGYREQLDPEAVARIDAYLRDNLDPRLGLAPKADAPVHRARAPAPHADLAARRAARSGDGARVRQEALALWRSVWDPRVPWYAKLGAAVVMSYPLWPIDVPHNVPILGRFDDVIFIALGLFLATRLIPPSVMADLRRGASQA
jgi:uncharacterized membrane protein YkvA (DUF1232 family)